MIDFLSQSFGRKKFSGTNWEFLVLSWNINNSDIEISDDLEMPDYSKLS